MTDLIHLECKILDISESIKTSIYRKDSTYPGVNTHPLPTTGGIKMFFVPLVALFVSFACAADVNTPFDSNSSNKLPFVLRCENEASRHLIEGKLRGAIMIINDHIRNRNFSAQQAEQLFSERLVGLLVKQMDDESYIVRGPIYRVLMNAVKYEHVKRRIFRAALDFMKQRNSCGHFELLEMIPLTFWKNFEKAEEFVMALPVMMTSPRLSSFIDELLKHLQVIFEKHADSLDLFELCTRINEVEAETVNPLALIRIYYFLLQAEPSLAFHFTNNIASVNLERVNSETLEAYSDLISLIMDTSKKSLIGRFNYERYEKVLQLTRSSSTATSKQVIEKILSRCKYLVDRRIDLPERYPSLLITKLTDLLAVNPSFNDEFFADLKLVAPHLVNVSDKESAQFLKRLVEKDNSLIEDFSAFFEELFGNLSMKWKLVVLQHACEELTQRPKCGALSTVLSAMVKSIPANDNPTFDGIVIEFMINAFKVELFTDESQDDYEGYLSNFQSLIEEMLFKVSLPAFENACVFLLKKVHKGKPINARALLQNIRHERDLSDEIQSKIKAKLAVVDEDDQNLDGPVYSHTVHSDSVEPDSDNMVDSDAIAISIISDDKELDEPFDSHLNPSKDSDQQSFDTNTNSSADSIVSPNSSKSKRDESLESFDDHGNSTSEKDVSRKMALQTAIQENRVSVRARKPKKEKNAKETITESQGLVEISNSLNRVAFLKKKTAKKPKTPRDNKNFSSTLLDENEYSTIADDEDNGKENDTPTIGTSTVTEADKPVSTVAVRAKKVSKRPKSPREFNNVTNTLKKD